MTVEEAQKAHEESVYQFLFGKPFMEIEKERMEWALKLFPKATAVSSLRKAEGEIVEIERAILTNADNLLEEYVDTLMCIFDSAGRSGFTTEQITEAYAAKFEKNKARRWKHNHDNTYSHVK